MKTQKTPNSQSSFKREQSSRYHTPWFQTIYITKLQSSKQYGSDTKTDTQMPVPISQQYGTGTKTE